MHIKETILRLADKISVFKTAGFLNELLRNEKVSTEEMAALKWKRLKNIIEFAYAHTEFYREKFKKAGITPGDIKSAPDMDKIPFTTKKELVAQRSRMIASSAPFFVRSSGTAGDPVSSVCVGWGEASKKYAVYLRHLLGCGFNWDTKLIYFIPACCRDEIVDMENGILQLISTAVQNKIAHNLLTNRKICLYNTCAFPLPRRQLEAYIATIARSENVIVMGRAEFLNIFACSLNKYGLTLPVKPVAVINIGSLLPEALARRISSVLGAGVFDIYGSSELSYVAGSYQDCRQLCINEETHYAEVYAKKGPQRVAAGRWGPLIVTDLINYSMPMIRYRTGDLGRLAVVRRGFREVPALEIGGRESNFVVDLDGALLAEKDICEAVFADENIAQFQLVVSGSGEKVLKTVECLRGGAEKALSRLERLNCGEIRQVAVERMDFNTRKKMQYISVSGPGV